MNTKAPELLKQIMPMINEIHGNLVAYGYTKGTPEYDSAFNTELAFYRKFVGI
jgi:hypothetical protein